MEVVGGRLETPPQKLGPGWLEGGTAGSKEDRRAHVSPCRASSGDNDTVELCNGLTLCKRESVSIWKATRFSHGVGEHQEGRNRCFKIIIQPLT